MDPLTRFSSLLTMRPPPFAGDFRDDDLARAVYAEGAGIARATPRAVAMPFDADAVATLVSWARASGISLIPRGSGSGMAGGAVGSGVIVDLCRLQTMETVDAHAKRIVVGAGVIRDAIDRAARQHGLRFPVDPSSGAFCTIGGMIATNAAGAHTLRYGPTRAWVHALDCVFEDGSRATVRRGAPPPDEVPAISRFLRDVAPLIRRLPDSVAPHPRKNSSGYALSDFAESDELIDLLVGSEGTLAVFAGAELMLAPVPGATAAVLAAFPTIEASVRAAIRAREAGAAACELLDRTFLEVVRSSAPVQLPEDTDAVLLIELEAEHVPGAERVAKDVADAVRNEGASVVSLGLDALGQSELWDLRHAASPILARLDPALRSMQFIEDGAVPADRLAEYVLGVREALDRWGVRGVIFGHAGDAHVHVNPLVDVSRPVWRQQVEGLLADVVTLTARLGGTLAGEHGDGRLRTPLIERIWPPAARELFALVKRAFDPAGILNPGVKVPLPGQRALEAIKYDPLLPALPDRARVALARVERERLYARARLEMLAEGE